MPPAAYIFDMDDLLVHSAPLWKAAETHLLNRLGHEWTPQLAIQYKGMNALDVAATIHRLLKPDLPVAECQKIMRDRLIAAFAGPVEPMDGAVDLVKRIRGRKPMALASGSPMIAIESALGSLGIRDCFDQLLTSESVARGKPHPDVFLAAAKALNTLPPQCLVFEDSLIGVKAAKAAQMRCFSVPSSTPDSIAALADRVFPSLANISDADLEA